MGQLFLPLIFHILVKLVSVNNNANDNNILRYRNNIIMKKHILKYYY